MQIRRRFNKKRFTENAGQIDRVYGALVYDAA